jgi:trans-aconitate methyltransferase
MSAALAPRPAPDGRPTLDVLGLRHGTDKASGHHDYLAFYERFLRPIRDAHMRVLEIGVREGASLRMWADYFPNATIVGIDIDPECRRHAGGRISVEVMDQSDLPALAALARGYGPFGLIVDDGSHIWEHQITALRHLYPHLQPGGCYILEDLDTSYGDYEPMFRGHSTLRPSAYLQRFRDHLMAGGQLDTAAEEDAFIRSCGPITDFVAFARRTALLRRTP